MNKPDVVTAENLVTVLSLSSLSLEMPELFEGIKAIENHSNWLKISSMPDRNLKNFIAKLHQTPQGMQKDFVRNFIADLDPDRND